MEWSSVVAFGVTYSAFLFILLAIPIIVLTSQSYIEGEFTAVAQAHFTSAVRRRSPIEFDILSKEEKVSLENNMSTNLSLPHEVDALDQLVATLLYTPKIIHAPRLGGYSSENDDEQQTRQLREYVQARRKQLQDEVIPKIARTCSNEILSLPELQRQYTREVARAKFYLAHRAAKELVPALVAGFAKVIVQRVAAGACIGIFIALLLHVYRVMTSRDGSETLALEPIWQLMEWFITAGSFAGFVAGIQPVIKGITGVVSQERTNPRNRLVACLIILTSLAMLAFVIGPWRFAVVTWQLSLLPAIDQTFRSSNGKGFIFGALALILAWFFVKLLRKSWQQRFDPSRLAEILSHLAIIAFILALSALAVFEVQPGSASAWYSLIPSALFFCAALFVWVISCIRLAIARHHRFGYYRSLGLITTYIWHPTLVVAIWLIAMVGTMFGAYFMDFALPVTGSSIILGFVQAILFAAIILVPLGLIGVLIACLILPRRRKLQDQHLAVMARLIEQENAHR